MSLIGAWLKAGGDGDGGNSGASWPRLSGGVWANLEGRGHSLHDGLCGCSGDWSSSTGSARSNDLSILARLATNDGNVLGTPRSKPAFVLTCGPDGHWDFNDGSPKRFNPLHVPNSLSQSAHPEGPQQLLLKAKVLPRHFYRHHD